MESMRNESWNEMWLEAMSRVSEGMIKIIEKKVNLYNMFIEENEEIWFCSWRKKKNE